MCFPVLFKICLSLELVAHTYNPSYLEDWDQEDCGLKAAQASS
jgi:hypothetical protein